MNIKVPMTNLMCLTNVFLTELFARLAGVKNFWGRDKGICRAWLAYDPYIYLTEASKVEVIVHFQSLFVL